MSSTEVVGPPDGLVPRVRQATLAAGSACLLVIALIIVISGAPVAWLLLGICAVLAIGALVVTVVERRYFEPLTVIAAFATAAFAVRPFDLFLNSTQLISFTPPIGQTPVQSLLRLDNSEPALFSTMLLHGGLESALTRAVGACAVFLVGFVAAYLAPVGARLGRRLVTLGHRSAELNPRAAIGIALLIGVAGQAEIVHKTGGLSRAANSQLAQTALTAGLVYYVAAGFWVAAVLVWAAWTPPRTPRTWALFGLTALEPCVFYLLVGSRTHVLGVVLGLIVVTHYRWRRLRLREVAVAFIVGLVLAAAMLAVRQATETKSFTSALSSAPAYIEDPRGLLNNLTQFDQLYYATSSIGVTIPFKHGAWIGQAFASYIPHALDPHKPQPPDITFRKDIFGNSVGAGRPPTVVGDLYFDFGFPGIAVGAVIVGVLARMLLCLLADAEPRGSPFRIALYGLSLFVLFELVSNGVAIAIGYILTLIVPLLVTALGLGRIRSRPGRSQIRRRSRRDHSGAAREPAVAE